MSARDLPKLVDCATLARELGIKREGAEAIMRNLPKVQIPGYKKVYVRRADVEKHLAENTRAA